MTPRRPHLLVALLGLAAAACGSSTSRPSIGLSQPSAVAVFTGYTTKSTELHPYIAIASAAKDELVLVDAVDDTPVLAPVVIHPLAVPVLEPRPAALLAGSLADGKPDLLVAISAGSTVLQVVQTWTTAGAPDVRVLTDAAVARDLADVAPGAEILTAIAAPVPVLGDAGWTAGAGRVRVIASLTGGRIAVVEYARDPGPDGGIVAGTPAVQDLGFEALSLAVNPADPRFVYAATVDPIPTASGSVQGVAELDATGAPGAWTFRGLDARGPTLLVAAFRVRERTPDSIDTFQPTRVDRVYAYLDPGACGESARIGCGLAVLDPVTGGIPPDPAGYMPYLAPIAVPATPRAIAISPPPALPLPGTTDTGAPFMRISPASGARITTAVAALPASDGNVYYVDLARWAVPNDVSILRDTKQGTEVTGASVPSIWPTAQRLGLWYTPPTPTPPPQTPPVPAVSTDAATMAAAVTVTPGYTPTDNWTVIWQGTLPGLDLQRAVIGDQGGRPWLAMQVPLASGGFTRVVRLYDPTLGVHVGDLAIVSTAGIEACGVLDQLEAKVAELLPPTAAYPGGALLLEPGDPPACVKVEATPTNPNPPPDCSAQLAYPGCFAALVPGVEAPATIRSGDILVMGARVGYAGRAPLAVAATDPGFELRYDEDEDAIACPLLPWPSTSPPVFPACDAACRQACEHLVLVRKARRIYHVSDDCAGGVVGVNECNTRWKGYPFPRANGPVVAFKVGLVQDPLTPSAPIARELPLVFSTRSGLSLSYRKPPATTASSVLPVGITTFDRSPYKAAASYRFLVPYVDGHVLDFSPAEFFTASGVIR